MKRAFAVALLALALTAPARAHDIYLNLHRNYDGTGMLCCGGDEKTGDCEGISDFTVNADGSARMFSRRYNMSFTVAPHMITWMAVPGGDNFQAHFCGKPRALISPDYTNLDQIDAGMWIYCAFITPGGV